MRSFKEVLNSSKDQVLESRKNQIEQEKIALLEHIKTNLMITCKIKELNEKAQKEVLNILLEYWSPKKGINKAGVKFLNENSFAISENSSAKNVELFAKKEVKDHINEFVNAFVCGNGKLIVEKLQNNIQCKISREIKFNPLYEMVSNLVFTEMKNMNN